MAEKNILYKKILSKDNLIRAWDHVRYDSINDFAPDCFGYDDVGANVNKLIKIIHDELSSDNYQAFPLKHVDVPKSTLAVRPGSVPEIEDRLVSYAIMNIIAPKIDKEISDTVYSFRVKKDYEESKSGLFEERKEIPYLKKKTLRRIALIEDWFYDWPEFHEVSKRLYEEEGYNFLSISDVSSYFENIHHELLREQLLGLLPNEQKVVNLLMEILDRWVWKSGTLRRLGRGIAQGNDVSSFLGNIFLMPLDEMFEEYSKTHDIKYIRYMDDIKIFSKSEDLAREVLFAMNNALRDLYLNIQGSKTQILKDKEIEKELFPPGMEELNEIIHNIENAIEKDKDKLTSQIKKGFESELKSIFKEHLEEKHWGKLEQRLFSRLLTGFKYIESRAAVERCLTEIRENPDAGMNARIISYLKLFPNDENISKSVADFLLSDINKFKYQEAHLFLLFRYLNKIPEELFNHLYNIVFDEEKNWFNRSAALVAMGSTKLSSKILKELMSLYDKESNTDVKRAIALCLSQLNRNDLIAFTRDLRGELNNHLTSIGNYYEKVLFNKDNLAQELISKTKDKPTGTDFYKEHFYTFYLLAKVDKNSLKEDLAKRLEKNYEAVNNGKIRDQIRYLYKEITHVEL
ncbi:MAG: reverse transcriptase domain-containing protein [Halobacteriota archaeon]